MTDTKESGITMSTRHPAIGTQQSRPGRRRRAGVALGMAGLTLGLAGPLLAGPASARTIGAGVDTVDETYSFSNCGYHLTNHTVRTSTYVDKLRGGNVGDFTYLTPWFTFNVDNQTQTITNDDTGISFVVEDRNSTSRDQQLLGVDGTVFTYRRAGTTHFTVFRPDGRVYYRVNGEFSFVYDYDTLGTPFPSDDTFAFRDGSYRFNGRDPGADFCNDVRALTVP